MEHRSSLSFTSVQNAVGKGMHFLLTSKILERALQRGNVAKTGRNSMLTEYFQRIIRRSGADTKFEDLITTGVLGMTAWSNEEHLVSQVLHLLPERKRDQLLTRDI